MEQLPLVAKAFAYITEGRRLLVFSHPDFPEAGIQVPAGTIKPGETPAEAVLREAFEETGLEGLTLVGALGEQDIEIVSDDGERQLHHRHFFHLQFEGQSAAAWEHFELHDGLQPPTRFELFWAPLDDLPELIADHDKFVPELRASLKK